MQRETTHAEWRHTGGKLTGDPQGVILGPILFNIFINDIFFFLDKTRIGNYADDNTTYGVEKDVIVLENSRIRYLYSFKVKRQNTQK